MLHQSPLYSANNCHNKTKQRFRSSPEQNKHQIRRIILIEEKKNKKNNHIPDVFSPIYNTKSSIRKLQWTTSNDNRVEVIHMKKWPKGNS